MPNGSAEENLVDVAPEVLERGASDVGWPAKLEEGAQEPLLEESPPRRLAEGPALEG
jgi:hypothetical protein